MSYDLLFIEPIVNVAVATSNFLEGVRTKYADYEVYIPMDVNSCFDTLRFQLPITDMDSASDFDRAQDWTAHEQPGVLRLQDIGIQEFNLETKYTGFSVFDENIQELGHYLRGTIFGVKAHDVDSPEDFYNTLCVSKSDGEDRKLGADDKFEKGTRLRSTFEDVLNHLFLGTTTTPSGVQVKPPTTPADAGRDAIEKWLVYSGTSGNLASAIFDQRQSQDLMRKVLLLGKYSRHAEGYGVMNLNEKDVVSIPVDLQEHNNNVISVRLNFVQTQSHEVPRAVKNSGGIVSDFLTETEDIQVTPGTCTVSALGGEISTVSTATIMVGRRTALTPTGEDALLIQQYTEDDVFQVTGVFDWNSESSIWERRTGDALIALMTGSVTVDDINERIPASRRIPNQSFESTYQISA
jgi:hypothetical protein